VTKIANTILGRMQTQSPCTTCSGSGEIIASKPSGADARGLITKEETVSIKIPAGVEEGMQLKVSGKGNEAGGNSIPGDLMVVIKEEEHDTLKREGKNLHYDLRISFSEAVLGASKEIDTVDGKVRIKIEKGTQSGKVLRLRSKGLSELNGYSKGDLLVHVLVWTPQKLNAEQTAFFENCQEDQNFKPNPNLKDKSTFDRIRDMFS
jgi:molecular chaperone DnaJ